MRRDVDGGLTTVTTGPHVSKAGFELPEPFVDVWTADLSVAAEELPILEALLSSAERERASRFHFDRDRRRFIAAHGHVRRLLARYVGKAPEAIAIDVGRSGKPFLRSSSLEFNLGHSDDRLVVAVARRSVGVDVERIRSLPDLLTIAARFFAAEEYETMRWLTGAPLEAAFFRCWTLKEAYLKACGAGLSVPLSAFQVSLEPTDPRLLACDRDQDDVSRWEFAAWSDGAFAVALAAVATGAPVIVRRRSWPL